MMLTERGWAFAGAAVALFVLWVMFGETELGIASLLLFSSVIAGVLFVGRGKPRIQVGRRTSPSAVHEGDHAAVTLQLRNRGRTLRHVTITEEVAGLGTAEFAVAAVAHGKDLTATYRILCRPRGMFPIGPTFVTVTDPLGMARVTATTGSIDSLVVYPAVESLREFPAVRGRNLVVTSSRPEHNQRGGEDFYTLREYQQGDDLRRVHWPSSARRDELMIRQLETPWQARALVVLDVRSESYPDERSFEKAVSGAASVVHHLVGGGFAADLWAGGAVVNATRYTAAMEALATVSPDPDIDILTVAGRLRRPEGGGVLVLVGGEPDYSLLGLQRLLATTHPATVLMSVITTASTTLHAFQRAGVVPVTVEPDQPWAPAWANAMRNEWHFASAGS
ncbi:MAG TPA: DUF58 domain-containing protein [Acidimicrobiia bacterium]|nr:DUF58 domain-containing protein [Acidimicrobiia bacterium]